MEFEQRFFQLCRNFSTKMSKMNFTCPENHFDKNIKLTLSSNFRLGARKCLICCGNFAALISNLLFCLQMGNWKNSFERIFTFSDFFRTSWEHFLVFLVYPSRLGGANWIPQAKMNISIRKKFVRKLFVLSGLWAHFFEHSLKSFRHIVKTTVYFFIGAIWERLFFFDFFKIVFGLWAIILQTSGEKFPQRCANCIIRVQRASRFFLQNFVMFHLTSCSSENKS